MAERSAHVQLLTQLSEPALLDRLEAVWGKVPRVGSPEKKKSDVSVMPEGLLDKLTEPQIRDLFRYLQSQGAP